MRRWTKAPAVCPCGHGWVESHPLDDQGRRVCSRAIGELPSCTECAAVLSALLDSNLWAAG